MADFVPTWNEVQDDLAFFDGALLDILVPQATSETWKRALAFLTKESDFHAFFIDGAAFVGPFPSSFEEATQFKDQSSVLAAFHFGRLVLNCHFYSIESELLDANPREIPTESAYLHLVGICKALANHIEKPVHLCGEGIPDQPIAVFDPFWRKTGPEF